MQPRLQIVSIIVSAGVFLLMFELVRRRRLMERYALLWLLASSVLLGLSVWSGLLDQLSTLLGVRYGPSVLFAVALGFGFILMLHFSLVLSRLSDQNKVLAQRVALLQERIDQGGGDRPSSSSSSSSTSDPAVATSAADAPLSSSATTSR